MNDRDAERFESELGKLRPARPPEEFMARLTAAMPGRRPQEEAASLRARGGPPADAWGRSLRWLAPATVAVAAGLALTWWIGRLPRPGPGPRDPAVSVSVKTGQGPDDIVIDQRLVAAYDAVALLPGGEPVRFRCREWLDQVVFRDAARGLEIERSTPRLEVVPVSFETY